MLTINEKANKEILKAKKAIANAIDLLTEEPAYNNRADIFHNTTVNEVNRLITSIEILND